jgi:Uma2 family endonuclease
MTAMPPKLTDVPALSPRPGEPFRFTREQYYELNRLGYFDGINVERLRGEIVVMPAVNWSHALAVANTADQLREAFAGVAWINYGNPLPTDDSDPQPDVMVVPGHQRDYTDHPTVALLVVEVSATTLDRDTTVKAEIYATAGVTDYWVLDLDARRLIVFRDPAPLPADLGGFAYRTRMELLESDTVSPLAAPAAALRVADLLP